jgi:hypothetical protein
MVVSTIVCIGSPTPCRAVMSNRSATIKMMTAANLGQDCHDVESRYIHDDMMVPLTTSGTIKVRPAHRLLCDSSTITVKISTH